MAGKFVWFDLMTTDPKAAAAFYTKGLGWTTQTWDGPLDYTMFVVGEEMIGGIMTLPQEARDMGAPPHWLGYIGVDDLDAKCAQVKSLGGKVLMTQEVPKTGRFAVIQDPQGVHVALFQSSNTPKGGDGSIQAMGWGELMTPDPEGAWAFYSALCGWNTTGAMEMGDMGTYQMFGFGEKSLGGMMKDKGAFWLYYFTTDDTDQRVKGVQALGAKLLNGPMEVPGGDRIAVVTDAQGAAFGIHAPPK